MGQPGLLARRVRADHRNQLYFSPRWIHRSISGAERSAGSPGWMTWAVHWQIAKENKFNCLVFIILLYFAKDNDGKGVITAENLADAFERSDTNISEYIVRCRNSCGDLASLKTDCQNKLLSLRQQVITLWSKDINLTPVEIRSQLEAIGVKASIGQINESIRKIDLSQFITEFRENLLAQAGRVMVQNRAPNSISIESIGENYLIKFNDLYWNVDQSHTFAWTSILASLYKARDENGKPIITLRPLAKELGCQNHHYLDRLLRKFDCVADHYKSLYECFHLAKHDQEKRLQQIILDIWLKDFTLSLGDIQKHLLSQHNISDLSKSQIRRLISSVDFWSIRKAFTTEYQKGTYSRSTKSLIKKYQQMINDLLLQLSQGNCWSKAQIDEFIAQRSIELAVGKKQEKPKITTPSTNAWLKCFLFGLPKKVDGKICCPRCGEFDTANKSATSENKIVTDTKTGQTFQVPTYRYYCYNQHCTTKTFTAADDGSHVLEEERYSKICLMLRLVFTLHGPYRSVADLLGTTKSQVFDELSVISKMTKHWQEILGATTISGIVCIDEKFVKIAEFKKTKKRPFGYAIFAVDPATGDLLHSDVFHSRDGKSAETFLFQLKAKGIYPHTIMTDLTDTYDKPIRVVYGRSVTLARCHFHFKQNIFKHMNNKFGKKNIPEIAEQLKEKIFDVVDAKTRKTIKKRFKLLQNEKADLLAKEPLLEPMFNCMESYLTHLLRTVELQRVSIRTNNPCEIVIKSFNQRYKTMSGFKSIDTAKRHVQLFSLVYRFTPFSLDVKDLHKRGKSPLQLAGYDIEHMPLFKYLTEPLLFNIDPAKNLSLLQDLAA